MATTPTKGVNQMTHQIPAGTDVKVHMNLHKRRHGHPDQWSVIDAKSGKVLATVESITLVEAYPVTSNKKKYQDILKDNKRRVVADVRGIVTHEPIQQIELYEEVHYSPWRSEHFTYQDESKYEGSCVAHFPRNTTHFLAL